MDTKTQTPENMPLAMLRAELNDLYKDVTGFRPRHLSLEFWSNRDSMVTLYKQLVSQL